jgi:signal transduction histidine kinase
MAFVAFLTTAIRRPHPSHFVAGALALLAYAFGALEPIERQLIELRFEVSQRPASGGLVLVEIDAKSLHELDTWPWPRRYHAELIERLLDSGVEQIVVDVDFSARSTAAEDEALARAISRAGDRLVLPTFVQGAQALSSAPAYENLPHAAMRGSARLGTANVRLAADGRLWRYSVAEEQPSGFRPSLAVFLAGTGYFRWPDFLIDFGIRAETIKRVSYVDVLRGTVPPEVFRGRDVLVGSTAAELGDYLAMPVYRALSGVFIHALAYESIVQGRMIQRTGSAVTVLGLLVLLLALARPMGTDEQTWPWAAAAGLVAAVAIVAGGAFVHARYAIAVDGAAWLVAVFAMFLAGVVRRLRQQAILIFRQRMAQMHQRALMRLVVEDSFDGILIAGETGRIEHANRAAAQILGRDSAIIGQPLDVIMPGARALTYGPAPSSDGTARKHELQIQRENGTSASLEVVISASELRISKGPYERRKHGRRVCIYTFRDVTESRRTAEAQRSALEAAISASRAKSQFLANMSHELRTPLNAIIGFSEVMLGRVFGPLGSERYAGYVRDIHSSGTHLLGVIQQVLDVSRIEAGTMKLSEDVFAPREVIEDCTKIIRGWLAAAPRRLVIDVPPDLPDLRADRQLVRQMLLNLLSNAIKFTRRDGLIGVAANLDGGGDLAIDVYDDGIGIPADQMSRLAQAFYQVDAAVTGTGLGLYLVRHFIDLHGGTLTLSSQPGQGTRARIWFPRWRLVNPPAHGDTGTPANRGPTRASGGPHLKRVATTMEPPRLAVG